MTLQQLRDNYTDTEEYHSHIQELFTQQMLSDDTLRNQREYIRNNVLGMGEDAFPYFWRLLLGELPDNAKLLEIGVHKAQVLSLWRILKPGAGIFGVTPLDGRGTGWTEDNYADDIVKVHNHFGIIMPELIIGASQDKECVELAESNSPYDVVYIDGSHEFSDVEIDLMYYPPMVKSGGWLVIDDAACRTKQKFGVFQGIDDVCRALSAWEQVQDEFEFQFNIVHLMVYKKK